jgi:cytochrome c oxidase assembly factor CtaG
MHVPALYGFALSDPANDWLIGVVLLLSSIWLWHDILHSGAGHSFVVATASMVAMTGLIKIHPHAVSCQS